MRSWYSNARIAKATKSQRSNLHRCTGRDFDAIFRPAWLILPWTSQAACGSGQLLPSIFSTLFRLCLAMQMSLHVNLRYMPIWNWLCAFGGPEFFALKSVRLVVYTLLLV